MIKEGYTRVTQIIGWYKSLVFGQIDPIVFKKKTQIGTDVHEAIDGFYSGAFIPLDERSQKYFESFKRWEEHTILRITDQEQRFYCDKLKITGAVDMIGIEGDEKIIVDFKTSSVADKKGWALQAAFYHYLCPQKIDKMVFIKLDQNGDFPKIFDFKPTEELWTQAFQCYEVYKFWNK